MTTSGSDAVWDAVDEFKNRWEEGVNNLCQDVEEMAGRLGKIAMNYYETDKAGQDALTGLASTIAAVKVSMRCRTSRSGQPVRRPRQGHHPGGQGPAVLRDG